MKGAIAALSLCQRLYLKLDQMIESKTRETVNAKAIILVPAPTHT